MFGHVALAFRNLWTASETCWDVTMLLADWPRYGLCLTSVIANCKVLYHHLTEQPHPKFLIHWRRKICIRTHIVSGACEMVFALLAFGTCRPLFSCVACVFCISHVLTSSYLMSGLFGIRNIMIPCYGFAVTVHAVNAIRLFLEPSSIPKLVDMFLTLQIYVWVRVMYAFIETFATMARYQYTISVMVAGMIIGPALSMAGGLMANLFVLAAIAAWNMIYPSLPPCCKHAYPGRTDDGDYKMDKVELGRNAWGAKIADIFGRPITPPTVKKSVANKSRASRSSSFSVRPRQSLHYYETLGEQTDHDQVREEMPYRRRNTSKSRKTGAFSALPQAEVEPQVRQIFLNLCDDAAVGMTQEDMERLLAVWGLPYTEARYVFAELRPNLSNPNIISLDEFHNLLEPVWRYTLECMENEEDSLLTVSGTLNRNMTSIGDI